MMNPLQLLQMLNGARNPAALMQQMLGGNAQFQRALKMAEGKSPAEIRQTAINLCQQSGLDIDKAAQTLRDMGLDLPPLK